MKFLLIIILLIPFDIVHTTRNGEKTVNFQKKGQFINQKWVENGEETTAFKEKNGIENIHSKSSSSREDTATPNTNLIKNVKPVSVENGGQTVTATTNSKSAAQPKIKSQKEFSVEALEAINQKRKNHGVKPLVQNKKLQKSALEMAKNLAKKKDFNARIPTRQDTGTSVYYKVSTAAIVELHGKDPIENWYKEFEIHDFSSEPTAGDPLISGHFSQMVWKDTTDVGIAYALSDDKKVAFVVTLFSPRGNWVGEFMTQVLPLKENEADDEEVGSSAQSEKEEDFEQLFLKAHNDYRKLHQVKPLKLNDELNKRSQQWANELAKKDEMVHSNNDNNGENLYMSWSSDPKVKPKARDAVDKWYNEIEFYKFQKPKFEARTGHFTQVVWKGSTDLGVGIAQNKKSKWYYVVAKYKPAGNYMNQFKSNVLPKN